MKYIYIYMYIYTYKYQMVQHNNPVTFDGLRTGTSDLDVVFTSRLDFEVVWSEVHVDQGRVPVVRCDLKETPRETASEQNSVPIMLSSVLHREEPSFI